MSSDPIIVDQPRPLGSDSALALTGPAMRDVIAHRLAQIETHGYDREHDAGETVENFLSAAESYLNRAAVRFEEPEAEYPVPLLWPWEDAAWKPGPPRRMLVKAAALILAAIDRIDADTQPDQRQPVAGGASPFPEAGGDAPVPSPDRRHSAADGASPLPQTGGGASVLPPDQRHPAADGASPFTVCGDAPPALSPETSRAVDVRYGPSWATWAAPGDQQQDAWLIRFCDQDCRDVIFTGPDAEREAWDAWNRYSPTWNIYLFRLAALHAFPPAVARVDGQ